eukprot:4079337-Alexandrium_andersonii.AAC.1
MGRASSPASAAKAASRSPVAQGPANCLSTKPAALQRCKTSWKRTPQCIALPRSLNRSTSVPTH